MSWQESAPKRDPDFHIRKEYGKGRKDAFGKTYDKDVGFVECMVWVKEEVIIRFQGLIKDGKPSVIQANRGDIRFPPSLEISYEEWNEHLMEAILLCGELRFF